MARDRVALGAQLLRIDPAWAAAAECLTAIDRRSLVDAHEALERRREQVEAGDSMAILQALSFCCVNSLPAPVWLAEAFPARLRTFTGCEPALWRPASLDQVFRSPHLRPGLPVLTGKDREDWRVGALIWRQVRRIARHHRGLEPALQQVLAAGEWPIRKSRARELVTLIDANQVHLSCGRIQPLSRLWRKARKQVHRAEAPASIRA